MPINLYNLVVLIALLKPSNIYVQEKMSKKDVRI